MYYHSLKPPGDAIEDERMKTFFPMYSYLVCPPPLLLSLSSLFSLLSSLFSSPFVFNEMNTGGMHDGDRAERVRAAVGVAVQVDHSQTQAHRSKESQEERGEGEGEEAEGQVVVEEKGGKLRIYSGKEEEER